MPAPAPPPLTSAAASTEDDRLDPALRRLAGVLLVGGMAAVLDATIVSVAIGSLGRELDATLSTIQWVGTAYLLALAVAIPLTGWGVERFGGRRMWLASLTGFLVGSVLCGLAWDATSLIAFRVVQGLGGGMLIPLMQTLLAQAAGPRRMGKAMALIAVPAQLGPILGPVIGGLIVDGASWRWIFLVNVPVCLVALALAARWLPATPRSRERTPLDVLGLALLSPGLATLVYGFSQAGDSGALDSSGVLLPVGIGLVLLAGFVVHALRESVDPIIDLRLLRARSFLASSGLMFVSGVSLFGGMFVLPLFEQLGRGHSAVEAGLLLAPQGAGTMLALLLVSRLGTRVAPRALVLGGMGLAAAATVPYAMVTDGTSEVLLGLALVLRGAGLGAAIVPIMTAAYVDLPPSAIPRATTSLRIVQQIGASLGTAVLAVILQRQIEATGDTTAAFGTTFWWTIGLTAAAIVPAMLLPGRDAGGGRREQAPATTTEPAEGRAA